MVDTLLFLVNHHTRSVLNVNGVRISYLVSRLGMNLTRLGINLSRLGINLIGLGIKAWLSQLLTLFI
jgi:hypothetical protein